MQKSWTWNKQIFHWKAPPANLALPRLERMKYKRQLQHILLSQKQGVDQGEESHGTKVTGPK